MCDLETMFGSMTLHQSMIKQLWQNRLQLISKCTNGKNEIFTIRRTGDLLIAFSCDNTVIVPFYNDYNKSFQELAIAIQTRKKN